MEPVKVSFDWNRKEEHNFGHTKDEWGSISQKNNQTKIQKIVAYKVSWENDDEKPLRKWQIGCTTCGQDFEYFGSAFCSKKCYEDYFLPIVLKDQQSNERKSRLRIKSAH